MSKIAISIRRGGKDLFASMDDRFGRAEAFLVVERETGEVIEIIDNPSVESARGAGTGAANVLNSAGVDAAISGRFGPKAFDALRTLGIETWTAPFAITAGDAFRMLADGGLEQMQSRADR